MGEGVNRTGYIIQQDDRPPYAVKKVHHYTQDVIERIARHNEYCTLEEVDDVLRRGEVIYITFSRWERES